MRRLDVWSVPSLRLSVDEVIHHDDVDVTVVRAGLAVAGQNPDARDPRVVEEHREERQVAVAGRGRHEAAVEKLAVRAEVLNQRAGPAVAALVAGTATVGLIDVGEDGAESADDRRYGAGAGDEELHLGDVTADRTKQPERAERLEDVRVARVAKRRGKATRRRLHESRPRRHDE